MFYVLENKLASIQTFYVLKSTKLADVWFRIDF